MNNNTILSFQLFLIFLQTEKFCLIRILISLAEPQISAASSPSHVVGTIIAIVAVAVIMGLIFCENYKRRKFSHRDSSLRDMIMSILPDLCEFHDDHL